MPPLVVALRTAISCIASIFMKFRNRRNYGSFVLRIKGRAVIFSVYVVAYDFVPKGNNSIFDMSDRNIAKCVPIKKCSTFPWKKAVIQRPAIYASAECGKMHRKLRFGKAESQSFKYADHTLETV